jgi:hypothetical protein
MDSDSRYFDPLVNTSCREMLFTMLRSPVIMWPARLYMNGELAHEVVYAYATPIVTQIFNYKHVLQDLNIDNFMCKFPIHI